MRRSGLVLCIVWLVTASAFAGDDLVTDRPDQTESAIVVPRGTVQLEFGVARERQDIAGVDVDVDSLAQTLVRVGLHEKLELRVGWDGYVDDGVVDGAGDAAVGFKVGLFSDDRGTDVALLAGTTVPTGDDLLTSDETDPEIRLAASHTLSDRLGLGYNIGAVWGTGPGSDGEDDTLSRVFYTVSLGIGGPERHGFFVELFGDASGSAGGGPSHSFDGGWTYALAERLQLDVAGGVGLNDRAPDWFVGVGISARMPR